MSHSVYSNRRRRSFHPLRTVLYLTAGLLFLLGMVRLIGAVWSTVHAQPASGQSAEGGAPAADTEDPVYPADLTGWPEALIELYEKNPDARVFVLEYFEKKDLVPDIDLSGCLDDGTIPLLMQWDARWGYARYSGDLLGLTGCGPTCLSMAAIYLTGDTQYNPRWMAEFSTEHGFCEAGQGSAWTLMSLGAQALGLSSEELPLSEGRIIGALDAGMPVICVLGPGDFTDSGHFIVLTGYADGAFTVNDPNSYANSARTWTYDELQGQIRNLWALSNA